jgi:uncharacterized delta-60 repeat protein
VFLNGTKDQPMSERNRPGRARPSVRNSRLPIVELLEDRCLLNAGALDRSFGDFGIVREFSGSTPQVALQSDGKVVLGEIGFDGTTHSYAFLVQRFNANGTVDNSFGTLGSELVTSSEVDNNYTVLVLRALAIQPDSRIVVSGLLINTVTNVNEAVLCRLNSDGTNDNTFGQQGNVIEGLGEFGLTLSDAGALALQPDGRLLIAGSATTSVIPAEFFLERFNSDGSIDKTFGSSGIVATDFPNKVGNDAAGVQALAIEPDGRIVAGGYASIGLEDQFAFARYNPDGTLDVEFHSGLPGRLVIGDTGFNDAVQSLGIQSDGSIVFGGEHDDDQIGHYEQVIGEIGLVSADGKLVNVESDFFPTVVGLFHFSTNIDLQPDGKIVAGSSDASGDGLDGSDSVNQFVLARLNPDLSFDDSFGVSGRVDIGFGDDPSADEISGVVLQPDGDIVAAGISYNGATDLVRALGDAGIFGFTASSVTVNEAAGNVTLAVSRSGGASGAVSISYQTADGTAVAGADYTSTSGTLNFADGQTTQTITVPLIEDGGLEGGSETFSVSLSCDRSDVQLGVSTASVVIQDPDIVMAPLSVTEGAAFTGVVATFVGSNPNADANDYAATITWSNGATSAGIITQIAGPGGVGIGGIGSTSGNLNPPVVSTNEFSVTGTGLYTIPGPGTFTVSITGADTMSATGTITVADAPLTATPLALTVAGGAAFKGPVATFSDANPFAQAPDFTASILWDNGTTSVGTVQGTGPFVVVASHFFPTFKGTHSIVITITDKSASAQVIDPVTDPPKNELFVLNLYQDLLQRSADDSGLAFWTGQLDGGATRLEVVQGIQSSYEYRADLVQSLYARYLHRAADPTGLATFAGVLGAGGTVEEVASLIAGSPEYYQKRGGGTDAGFVNAIYQDVLVRAPDATGQTLFQRALASGASRQQVAQAVLASTEYRQDLVQADYQAYLQRSADPIGLGIFTNALALGNKDEAIAANILASDEFFARLD